LDGGHLPDSGFFDPNAPWVSTEQTDIFSLASVFYTILTGHWPYRTSGDPFKSGEEKADYEQLVDSLFARHKFPDVKGLFGGGVITKCWMNKYKSAEEVLKALELEMKPEMLWSLALCLLPTLYLLPAITVPGLSLLFLLDCACGGGACRGGTLVRQSKLFREGHASTFRCPRRCYQGGFNHVIRCVSSRRVLSRGVQGLVDSCARLWEGS
jgi:hypothetical protein